MIRTRYVLLGVICLIVLLVGLLVAVRVFAPSQHEFVPLPAAVFSAVHDAAKYEVTAVEFSKGETARAELIEKLGSRKSEPQIVTSETSMTTLEPVTGGAFVEGASTSSAETPYTPPSFSEGGTE